MKKNILPILIVALLISVAAYFYIKKRNEKKALETPPVKDANTGTQSPPIIAHQTPATTIGAVQANPLPAGVFPLQYGSKGKAVQMLQVLIGVKPDGIWGAATDLALRNAKIIPSTGTGTLAISEFLMYVLGYSGIGAWPLVKGMNNNYVKALQIMFNLKIDGIFGTSTASACVSALGHPSCSAAEFQMLVKRNLNI